MSAGPLVLTTRSGPAAGKLRVALESRGYRAVSAPMLTIEREGALDPLALSRCDAVVLTSAAAARIAGEDLGGATVSTPAYCVGEATAAAARAAGFSETRSADGDAQDLLALLAKSPPARPLILRGADIAVDLAAALSASGSAPVESILYRATKAERLPEEAARALKAGEVGAALFYSARTAEAFLAAVAAEDGLDLSPVTALAIGERTTKPLRAGGFASIHAAKEPTEASLLELLIATIPRRH